MNSSDILPFLPLSIIIIFAIGVLLLEVSTKNKELLAYVSLGGIFLAILSTIELWMNHKQGFRLSYFEDMFVIDNYSLFFYLVFFLCAGISIFISPGYLRRENIEHGEYYSLILFAVTGMMLMASGGDLMVMFLGIEIMSIAIYVLVGFQRRSLKSNESALKYFFLGAFSSGFILYGIAFIYGTTNSTNLVEINQFLNMNIFSNPSLTVIGILLILIGMLFKVAAFPFHNWAPDVYEGASAPVTGFMITAVKAASFALFLKLFLVAFIELNAEWRNIIMVISVFTMFIGNLYAFTQENIKRMLAYSSISHTGYLLIGVASLTTINSEIANAILYYLVAYAIANLGIFACISYLSQKDEKYINIDDYSGLGLKYPVIGITMGIFMFSLIGVPPTAGFFGKYYLFSAALKEGMTLLVLIAIINSMLSIYYYLKVLVTMFLKEQTAIIASDHGKLSTNFVLVYAAIGTVWLGIGTFTLLSVFPGALNLMKWSGTSILSLF